MRLLSGFEGYGEIIAAAILFSFAGIFAKTMVGLPVPSIIFYRFVFAFAILFGALAITGNLGRMRLKGDKRHLVFSSLMWAATMLSFFTAAINASVSTAVLLLYTAPVYVMVLSPALLGERPTKNAAMALAMSIAGMLLIVGPQDMGFSHQLGLLAGVISGITYAFRIMVSKRIIRTYDGYSQAFWAFAIGMLVLLPAAFVPAEAVLKNTLSLALLAIFPTILAVSLTINGLKKVKASNASIVALIEPLSAVVLSALLLNEQVTAATVIGGALILAGAALVARRG